MLSARTILCGILLLLPTAAYAQNKNGPPAVGQPGTPEEYAQLNQQKEVRGVLVTRDEGGPDKMAKRFIIVRYDYEVMDKNPNYKPTIPPKPRDFTKEFQALQMKINQASQIPNAQKRMTALQNLAGEQQKLMGEVVKEQNRYSKAVADARDRDINAGNVPYIKVAKAKEFTLEVDSEVIVRRMKPRIEYDDKGFRKGEPDGNGFVGYTREELDKLHLVDNADGKKPGMPSKYDELKPKQKVTLALKPGKKDAKAVKPKADKSNADDEPFVPLRPTVRMIVIAEDSGDLNDVEGGALPPVKKKKKAKE